MPIPPRDFQTAFGDFSDLFAEADKKSASIHESAVPLLLKAVTYCAVAPGGVQPGGEVRARARSTWTNMLEEKEGQVILQADIRHWIRKWWLPDPIHVDRIPREIADWMKDELV